MKIVGRTSDGRQVVAGAFELVDTHGVPLELALAAIKHEGLVIDWPDFVATARAAGWNPKTIRARIASACADAHGPEHAAEVMRRIDLLEQREAAQPSCSRSVLPRT